MSSSTSNSDARNPGDARKQPVRHYGPTDRSNDAAFKPGNGWKTLAVVALALVALELFSRTALVRASKDLRRFETYPEKVAELIASPKRRIAFVGNSATQEGLDVELFEKTLAERGIIDVDAEMYVADNSGVVTWSYMLDKYFLKPDRRPDFVVINHFGPYSLADDEQIEIGRLARSFADVADYPRALNEDLTTFGKQAEFLISAPWSTYAFRNRIRDRVLGLVVPSFKDQSTELHEMRLKTKLKPKEGSEPIAATPKRTHRALERIIRPLVERKIPLCFVQFPMRDCHEKPTYDVLPESLDRLRAAGVKVIDLRRVPNLTPDRYRDSYHLNEEGKSIYTKRLAEALEPVIAELPKR
jgi:hypothetical protein